MKVKSTMKLLEILRKKKSKKVMKVIDDEAIKNSELKMKIRRLQGHYSRFI